MYIISFEVAGLCLAIILVFVHIFLYRNTEESNLMFQFFAISTVFECALDIFTAKNIDHVFYMPDILSVLVNTVYFSITIFSAYVGLKLIAVRLKYHKGIILWLMNITLVIAFGLLFINIFTGILFTFSNSEYIKTSHFMIYYGISFIFMFYILLIVLTQRKGLSIKERTGPYFFFVILTSAFFVQYCFPYLLLNGFAKAIAAMVFCLYLDTPEHIKLISSVAELEHSRDEQNKIIDELMQANENKNQFLIEMSHELRTPINAILGFDEMILNESHSEITLKKAKELQKVSNDLFHMVEDLMDFSQLEIGQLDNNPDEFEFVEAHILLNNHFNKLIEETNLMFTHSVSEEIPKRLYADSKRIGQVLTNLITTSIAHTPHGSIDLSVELDHIEDNQAFLTFRVRDTGTGAPVEIIEMIDRLQRGDILSEKEFEFFDFGLLLTVRVIQCLGSRLECKTDIGQGAEFYFTIKQEIVDLKPIGNIEAAKEHYFSIQNKDQLKESFIMPTARVLVVDDMQMNLTVFKGLIKQFAVEVFTASSGFEALDILINEKIDLVFLDILMPEMDGIETLRYIRESECYKYNNIKVIALTANVFSGARELYLSKGFDEYASKPISGARIGQLLMKLLPEKLEKNWVMLEEEKEDIPFIKPEKKYTSFLNKKNTATKSVLEKKVEETNNPNTIEGFNMQEGLAMCMGDMNLYKEVIRDFYSNGNDTKLIHYYTSEDWENYRILIHGMKSAAKTIGLIELSDRAKELEDAARALNIDYIRNNHEKWMNMFDAIVIKLKEQF